jgi:hypothetical protein
MKHEEGCIPASTEASLSSTAAARCFPQTTVTAMPLILAFRLLGLPRPRGAPEAPPR